MEPTKQDAQAMLQGAGGVQLAVQAGTPREHVPFVAWGLLLALLGPVRDLDDNSVVGIVLVWVALIVAAAIVVKYLRQSRRVRVKPRTPNWLAATLAAWAIATTTALPLVLNDHIGFAYTLGGVLGAVPVFFWAKKLSSNA